MIFMPACLAHLKNFVWPLYIYVDCALGLLLSGSAALQFTPISEPRLFRNDVHRASRQRCSFTTLTLSLTAQRRASAQRCSSPLSPLFTTLTASHRCAPPFPPITGRADERAARLAPEASNACGAARHCQIDLVKLCIL